MSAASREVENTYWIFEDIITSAMPLELADLQRIHPAFSEVCILDALYSLTKAGLIRRAYGKGKHKTYVVTTVAYEAAVLFGGWEEILDREGVPVEERL